jgi:selenocysteine lyase/cysteine desulfurase
MATFLDRRVVAFAFGEEYRELCADLRAAIGRLIGASPEEIAFVQNTTHGLNITAQSLPLEAGDNVVFCDVEFPANVYPWMLLERRWGIEARCIPNDGGGLTLDSLDTHADDRTRAVAVSSVEFHTGFRADLEAIGAWCRERGIYLVVDAIQSLGAAPLDVRTCHIDLLSCGATKWLMGPAGIGFLYCRRDLLEQLTPPGAGFDSVVARESWLDYDLAFFPDARRFELAVPNLIGMVGLLTAMELLLSVDIEVIHRRTLDLTDKLVLDLQKLGCTILSDRSPPHRSAVVSFTVPTDPSEAHARLRGAGVSVSLREGYIRVSPHGYNTEEEIARVGQVLGNADM